MQNIRWKVFSKEKNTVLYHRYRLTKQNSANPQQAKETLFLPPAQNNIHEHKSFSYLLWTRRTEILREQ